MRVAMAVLLLTAIALPAGAAEPIKPNRSAGKGIDAALKGVRERAMAYLRSVQHADGSWKTEVDPPGFPSPKDIVASVPGGTCAVTAWTVYALASAGVPMKDPAIVRAVRWMTSAPDPFKPDAWGATVAYAMRVLALARVDPTRFREQIHRDAATIVAGARADGTWEYDLEDAKARRKTAKMLRKSRSKPRRGSVLMSNLAAQALWATQQHAGYKVAGRTWSGLRRRVKKAQREDGTWADGIPSGSPLKRATIAAGLGSYVLARAVSPKGLPEARAEEVVQTGSYAWRVESESREWLSFVESAFYAEHAATAAGWKDAEWYPKIAARLLSEQRKDGSWAWGHETRDRREIRSTAAALLCISGASKQLLKPKTK